MTTFEADTIKACKAIVKEYCTRHISKSAASQDILNILEATGVGDPEQLLTSKQKD